MSPKLHQVDAVLFDLDGTLLDSAPDLGFAANQLRIDRGLHPLEHSHYRPFVGTGARGMLRIALGITPEADDFDVLREEFFRAYERCMGHHSQLFSGVESLLKDLTANALPWGIVTNKAERFALPIARSISVLASSGAVICGDTTAHSKPHPAPLLQAAQRLGVDPGRCIYVGDDERDMVAARAAGMKAVAASYGYLGGVDSVAAWAPDAVIDSPLELTRFLGLN